MTTENTPSTTGIATITPITAAEPKPKRKYTKRKQAAGKRPYTKRKPKSGVTRTARAFLHQRGITTTSESSAVAQLIQMHINLGADLAGMSRDKPAVHISGWRRGLVNFFAGTKLV